MTTRTAAGLVWTPDRNGAWRAEDFDGIYKLVEWAPGQWMDFFWQHVEGCADAQPAKGGRDWPDFDTAADEIVRLAKAERRGRTY